MNNRILERPGEGLKVKQFLITNWKYEVKTLNISLLAKANLNFNQGQAQSLLSGQREARPSVQNLDFAKARRDLILTHATYYFINYNVLLTFQTPLGEERR